MPSPNPPLSTRALPQPLLAQLAALTPAQLAGMTATERAEIAAALDAHERSEALRSHRAFAESPHYCGLTVSPLMAAVMDAADGKPVTTINDAQAREHFGCVCAELPRRPRALVVVRAGGRAGKTSRLLATKALIAALTVPVPTLGPGERAVALLMAPDLQLARQILGFVRGYCDPTTSPSLASRVLRDTADEIELRRPDGHTVAIRVRAASRGGRGGRGFVLVFAGLDEASFFRDEASGVVNDTEIFRAIEPRLVPGAQCWVVSTPWVAGVGLLEETLGRDFGTHRTALCVKAPTRALNPTWDPTGEVEAAMRERDPENADREILAIPLVSGSALFFDKPSLDAAVDPHRPLSIPPRDGATYGAGGDLAFRRNASALAITERTPAGVFELALAEERQPANGVPLAPAAVCDAFAAEMQRYRAPGLWADSHERERATEELARHDLGVFALPEGQGGKAEQYLFARRLLREGRVRLPKHPKLLSQLRAVTSKPAPGGGLTITSPTSPDGSHGDLASAWIASLWAADHASEPDTEVLRVPRRR